MKRALSIVLALLLVFSLAACGQSGGQKQDPAGTAASTSGKAPDKSAQTSDKPITLRFLGPETLGSPAYDFIMEAIDQFHVDNPNITVEPDLIASADLRTKITVEMAAGNPPEISSCIFSYAREFMRDNKIEPWNPIVEDHPEFMEWMGEKIIDNMKDQEGRILTMPYDASIDGLYCNMEIFEKYGWELPKTFDDMVDLAGKAKAEGITLLVAGGKDIRFAWLASALMAGVAGKEKTDALCIGDAKDQWDNPEYGFVTAMTKFKQLVDAGAYPSGVLGLSTNEADQAFARGEAAMYYEGAWKCANFETAGGREFVDKLERINFPEFTDCPDGDSGIRVGGNIWGLMIPVGLDEATKEAAIKFAKVRAGPELGAKIMESGNGVYAGMCEYDQSKVMKIFNQCIEAYRNAPAYMYSMDSYAAPSIDLAIKQTAMPGIISGEYDVAGAVAEVQRAAEDYLKTLE